MQKGKNQQGNHLFFPLPQILSIYIGPFVSFGHCFLPRSVTRKSEGQLPELEEPPPSGRRYSRPHSGCGKPLSMWNTLLSRNLCYEKQKLRV